MLASLIGAAITLTFEACAQPKASSSSLGLPPVIERTMVDDRASLVQTAARIALGEKVFFDPQLSLDGKISCASCHDPVHAFADGKRQSVGVYGRTGTRNAPSLLNVAFERHLFWDGRSTELAAQALEPLTNRVEHGLPDQADLRKRLLGDPSYVAAFVQAFDIAAADISVSHAGRALAAFEQTLIAADSAFDRHQYGHDAQALTATQRRGLALFTGAAGCAACHQIDATAALFTDHRFHRVNFERDRSAPPLSMTVKRATAALDAGQSIGNLALGDRDTAALGRFLVTRDPKDIGAFKTPSLRNVALTCPYFHDGSVATLDDAVDLEIYYQSQRLGRPLILTPQERGDLVAFLRALTSPVAVEWRRKALRQGSSRSGQVVDDEDVGISCSGQTR